MIERTLPLLAAATLLAFAPPVLAESDDEIESVEDAAPPPRANDYFGERFAVLSEELQSRLATPRAAATLYELAGLADRVESLAPLAQLLARTAEDNRASPDVRTLARWLLVDVELARGRLPRAKGHYEKLAFGTEGWISGGFDNEGGTGHATAFPPEAAAIDLKATYQGKEREIGWRRLPAVGLTGRVPVHELIRPRRNATFYFLTTLESSSAQRVALHLGTSGATKLWVNGQLAVDDEADHPARFDQRAVHASLRRGQNLVLLKVSSLEEAPAFFVRVAMPNGRPVAGVKWVAPSNDAPLAAPPSAPGTRDVAADRAGPAEDLVAQLARLVAAQPNDGALREDYAIVLAERRPFDTKTQRHRREQERAAQLLPKDARVQLRLAGYIDDDHNEARLAIERALAADPKFAPARHRLGLHYLDRGFVRRGHDELARAVADLPAYWPARLSLADALDALGLDARARRLELELAAEHPSVPATVLAAARAEKLLARPKAAIERYRVLLSMRYDDHQARSELASLLVDAGDVDGAAAVLEKSADLNPAWLGASLRLAELLSSNGRAAAALARYDRLVQLSPDDDQVVEARGRHRLREGDEDGALADLERALALKPQNPAVRELVRAVRPQENFAAPYLRDAVALAKAARAAPAPKGEDGVVLAELDVVRVYPNGLSSRTRQEIVHVLTDRAVERVRVQGLRYSPGEEEVKIERARIIKADGSIVEAKSESDRQLTESWAGMYFDNRQRVVSFPNVEPGDVVEFTYRKDDVAQANMFADYFGDVESLQGPLPVRDTEYVLIAPAAREFYANAPALPNVAHTVKPLPEGRREWRWAAKDVAKIEPEPKMRGWAETGAYLHVSTFREWNDVARFWWGLVREQLHVTPEVAAAAEEAVKGIDPKDVRARVRAVYGYVVAKTRYVGLEFGIHGFKPYKVDRVLARRFGDCKDKASLMYAMLKHLGVDSRLTLLRMRHLGQLAPKPASLAAFNHAILYVPELDLYLDGTAEFSGSSELPSSDQGAQVLVVEEDAKKASRFLVTPVSKPEDNVTSSEYDIALAADGSARVTGRSTVRGQGAQGYRRAYESESGRRERFEQGYARSYPGAKAISFEIGEPRAIEKPVETKFVIDVPQLARKEGDALAFSPFGESFRYTEATAPLSRREHVLELGPGWRNDFTYRIALPAGFELAELPAELERTTPFGSFRYRTGRVAGGLEVTGHVAFAADQVAPPQYPEFRSFLAELDRAFSRRLRLAPTGVATQAAAGTAR